MAVDHEDPTPLYVQVANELERMIDTGELAEGQPLPSEQTIQQTYDVARGTARRAIGVLRDRGKVYTLPQRGSFVKRAG